MKNVLLKIIFVFIIVLLFISSNNVYANGFDSTYGSGSILLSEKENSDKQVNGGKVCGVNDICFNGRGLYVYLVKYNSQTKKETVVGKPILYYTGNLFEDQLIVDQSAASAEVTGSDLFSTFILKNQDNVDFVKTFTSAINGSGGFKPDNNCSINLGDFTYESEILSEANSDDISYYVGKSDFTNGIKGYKSSDITKIPVSPKIDLTPDGEADLEKLANYVVKQVSELAAGGAPSLNKNFKTNEVKDSELDQYYLAFEYASRDKAGDVRAPITIKNKPITAEYGTTGTLQHEWTCNTSKSQEYQTSAPRTKCLNIYKCNTSGKKISGVNAPKTGCANKYKWDNETYSCKYSGCSGSVEGNEGKKCDSNKSAPGSCTCSCTGHHKGDDCSKSIGQAHCNLTKGEWTLDTEGKWTMTACDGGTVYYNKQLITIKHFVKTKIENARASGKSKLIKGMSTGLIVSECNSETEDSKVSSKAKKTRKYGIGKCTCATYQSRNGSVFRECFIGRELNNALVGLENTTETYRNTFRYSFGDSTVDIRNKANGVSYWWAPALAYRGCIKSEGGPCDPNDLKCAENVCENLVGYDDRADSYGVKKSCLIDYCHVKIPSDPCAVGSGSGQQNDIDDPQNNNGPNNSEFKTLKETPCVDKKEVSCSPKPGSNQVPMSGQQSALTRLGGLTYSSRGLEPQNVPSKVWCYSYQSTTSPGYENIDEKTFVNITCTESSNVQFTNPSQQKIIAGSGIYYNAALSGQKKCHVWFDMDSWQLEYAAFSDKEEVCLSENVNPNGTCKNGRRSREILEEILDNYNKMAKGNYTKGLGETIGTILDPSEIQNASITFEDLNYTVDEARSSVVAEVTETINGEVVNNGKYELKEADDSNSEATTVFTISDKTTKGQKYNRLSSTPVKANTYDSLSSVNIKYELDKYCLSTDQKGTVSKREVCYTISNKNGTTMQVNGQRLYYTSLKALGNTNNYNINFNTTAKIETINPSLSTKAMSAAKICEPTEFKQDCTIPSSSACTISFVKNDGTKLKNGIYNGANGIKAVLQIETTDLGNDEIVAYELVEGKTSETIKDIAIGSNKTSEINIKPTTNNLKESSVGGIIKLKSGKTYTCDNDFKMVNCTSKCQINKIENGEKYLKYSITNVSRTPEVYTSKDSAKLKVEKQDNAYNVTIKIDDSDTNFTIIAEDGNNCCSTDYEGGKTTPIDCINDFNKDGKKTAAQVKEYCENWKLDVSNFKGKDECVSSCWMRCPIVEKCDSKEIEKVEEYCEELHTGDIERKNQCVNACYNKTCGSNDYIYRPISNIDPFPQSQLSPQYKGTRRIGSNWVGYDKYITEDDDDESSVTGANKNINVEYIMDLDPSTIRKIRDDNEIIQEKDNKNGYVDYDYAKSAQQYVKYFATEYKSKFIHETYKNDIFREGIKTKDGYKRAVNYDN